jgi:tRNA(fMet)-specific endonuclease VapC
MHLLDTDTLTHLHAGHPRVVAHLQRADDPTIGTTVVTKIELLRGRFEQLLKAASGAECARAQERLSRTEELLDQIRIVPFDAAAAARFDRLRALPRLRLGRADLVIASIALAHRATLVTRNVRHFRPVSGLRVVNWVDQ